VLGWGRSPAGVATTRCAIARVFIAQGSCVLDAMVSIKVGMAEKLENPSSAKKTKSRASRGRKATSTEKPSTPSAAKARSRTTPSAPKGRAIKPTITKAQVEEQTRKFRRKADKYRDDPKKTEQLLKEAETKARSNPGPITGQLQDLATLLRMVRAYFSREYREMPWETIALAIGAIAYFVSPVDLIPDFLPVAGYVDDAAVVAFVIASASNDLQNFREWEARRQLGI